MSPKSPPPAADRRAPGPRPAAPDGHFEGDPVTDRDGEGPAPDPGRVSDRSSGRVSGRVSRRKLVAAGAALVAAIAGAAIWRKVVEFPPDTQPEGAYFHVAALLGEGNARDCFAYLEDAAQHAAYTIRDYRKKASDRVAAAYPEPERGRLLESYKALAAAPDGADVWAELGARHGWIARLRRDLSGVAQVEIQGDRATIQTTAGTRYAFRRRANGMWGLSLFTAELMAEAERTARDFEVVDKAAADYERAR